MENTKVVFIYGAPSAGKLTTAKEVVALTDFKLLHNHLTTDLVRVIFDRKDDTGPMLIAKFRFEMLEAAVKAKVKGLVMTGVYAHDFKYANGETDEWFAKEIERITLENGGKFYGVKLTTNNQTLFSRVISEDRKEWKKLTDANKLADTLSMYDFETIPPFEKNMVIDNTELAAGDTAKKIVDFISS
jgi:hypothetical protein